MDSIKLLDKVIIYQQQNEQSYPAQEHLLLQLCMRVTKKLTDNINSSLKVDGINDTTLMVLALLSSADNFCLSPTELSEKLDISRTNITRVCDSLEKFGFIRRMESKEDRRSKNIYLTPDGDLFLQKITRIYGRYLKKIWSNLTDDEIKIFKIISKKVLSQNIYQ
ncbi:MarR family transcriptional regulator [Escherichia coli]|uniref:Transcriptional repressor MprA n=5 Tax=Escherichia coli TaxID=562 RepID=A0A0F6YSZ9_ECOLX|nr:transcriptional regulator [Escherichia coli]AKF17019.1 Transcriptional repressor MprA [Escherichia coli O104:H21]ATG64547.1 transcriptional regulator [Escherichia coli O104:H21 str. CFSAN002236]EKH5295480.1 MarR family transcriptional regulator [Escherichia coli O26]EKH6186110.1 MarR family transcriptional regulator [Escherichia coli O111]EKH6195318.1 MarR family transcriptional regulator [Escherichia coli O103]EKJ1986514.1 MarR family transcriptional regulator [Escherichia coli O104]EKY3